jgi:hypothetical protein
MAATSSIFRFKFSLLTMLSMVIVVSLITWIAIQTNWIRKRQAWRNPTSGAVRSTQEREAPGLLGLFGEGGESWIEIKNGTDEQVAEVQRLFPEATVVIAGQQPTSHKPGLSSTLPQPPISAP